MKLLKGNYVKCPLDLENKENFRDFVYGKVVYIDEILDLVIVELNDIEDNRKYFDFIPEKLECNKKNVTRCKIINGSLAIYKDLYVVEILEFYKDIDGYNFYYARKYNDYNSIEIICEKDLSVQFDSCYISPIEQMQNFEIHNPVWYRGRVNMSKMNIALENAPLGMDLLLGSRVFLFEHQIETILKGLSMKPCRIMLADEVGLGKTIEACIIYEGLRSRNINFKTLIIVPKSLVNQWKNELSYKFWLDIDIWKGDILGDVKDIIVPLEELEEFYKFNKNLIFNLMILDETHRLLNSKKDYELVLNYSEKIENVILLSATPIQKLKIEYLDLLRLLEPEKYKNINSNEFDELQKKSMDIKEDMYDLVADLSLYHIENLGDEYIDTLNYINEKLQDPLLSKLINSIDLEDDTKGLNKIKIILSYISNNYEIEKNIVRNRRLELEKKNRFAKRSKEIITYEMADSVVGFYEKETYNSLVNYIEYNKKNIHIDTIENLFTRMFSSPWALNKFLDEENLIRDNRFNILKEYSMRWENSTNVELNNMEEYEINPDSIKSRILLLIDLLNQNFYDKKVVVFSNFKETANKFFKYLSEKVGDNTVTLFTSDMTSDELENSINKFQELDECKFLVCDKTGGEGRNLQMADAVLHIDLPWNPSDIEQRIGRLDRIGRSEQNEVKSVVIISEDTIEESIFNLWDEGLNIFEESLSGIEMAISKIQKEIKNSIYVDVNDGLRYAVENVKSEIEDVKYEVEREQYYDSAKNIDSNRKERIARLIDKFEGADESLLIHSMLTWFNLSGFAPTIIKKENSKNEEEYILIYEPSNIRYGSIRKSLFAPPNTEEALKRARRRNQIRGTFSKDLAINIEDLMLFAPGDVIYDDITKNAINSCKGRSNAFIIRSGINWKGFVFRWNIKFNKKYLLDKRINIEDIRFNYREYFPIEQFESYCGLTKEDMNIDEKIVKDKLDTWLNEIMSKSDEIHLGSRKIEGNYLKEYGSISCGSNIEWFKNWLSDVNWSKLLNSFVNNSKRKIESQKDVLVNVNQAKEDIENIIAAEKARSIYYNQNIDIRNIEDEEILELVIKGIEDPIIELDSIGFIWMVE